MMYQKKLIRQAMVVDVKKNVIFVTIIGSNQGACSMCHEGACANKIFPNQKLDKNQLIELDTTMCGGQYHVGERVFLYCMVTPCTLILYASPLFGFLLGVFFYGNNFWYSFVGLFLGFLLIFFVECLVQRTWYICDNFNGHY